MNKSNNKQTKISRCTRANKVAEKCKPFSLDLMHLSTNELSEIKDLAGLKTHLKRCRNCRTKLKKLRKVDLFSFLARPRSERFQKRMKALIDEIKASQKPGKKSPSDSNPSNNSSR